MRFTQKLILLLYVSVLALTVGCSSAETKDSDTNTTSDTHVVSAPDASEEETSDEEIPEQPSYPVITPKDMSDVATDTAENADVRVLYPSDKWIPLTDVGLLSFLYAETADAESGNAVNFNIAPSTPFDGQFRESDVDLALQQYAGLEDYMTIDVAELRYLNGETIIYTESTGEYTDVFIDAMIEEGSITEEWLEENGGREALLQQPASKFILIYAVVDDHICAFSGVYFEDVHKQDLLDAMYLAIETTEVL